VTIMEKPAKDRESRRVVKSILVNDSSIPASLPNLHDKKKISKNLSRFGNEASAEFQSISRPGWFARQGPTLKEKQRTGEEYAGRRELRNEKKKVPSLRMTSSNFSTLISTGGSINWDCSRMVECHTDSISCGTKRSLTYVNVSAQRICFNKCA